MKTLLLLSRLRFPLQLGLIVLLIIIPGTGFAQDSEDAPDSADEKTGIDEPKPEEEEEGDEGDDEETADSSADAERQSEVIEKHRGGVEKKVKQTGLYWDLGPHFDTRGRELQIRFSSRLHLDAAVFAEGDDIEAAVGESDNGIEVRRFFLELGAFILWTVEFNFQFDFAEQPDVRDLYAGFVVPFAFWLRVGHIREPFGLEMMTSSNDITFMERSLGSAFAPNRNLGVLLHRRFGPKRRLYTAFGIFEDTPSNPNFDEMRDALGEGNYALTGRMTGLPFISEDGRELFHMGAAVSYRIPSDDTLRFRSRPESHLAQVYVDTGSFDADHEVRLGLEAATVLGSLSLQSEFMVDVASGTMAFDDRVFAGFYGMASYVITGENRLYREQIGAFGRIYPDNPFPLEGWGAWEVAARYSYLNLDSEDVQGGELHDWTLGVNWYLNHYSRVMFNYVLSHPEGLDNAHIFQLRLQFTF